MLKFCGACGVGKVVEVGITLLMITFIGGFIDPVLYVAWISGGVGALSSDLLEEECPGWLNPLSPLHWMYGLPLAFACMVFVILLRACGFITQKIVCLPLTVRRKLEWRKRRNSADTRLMEILSEEERHDEEV